MDFWRYRGTACGLEALDPMTTVGGNPERTDHNPAKEAAAKVYDTELAAFLAILDGKPWATADETQAETYRVVGAGLLVEALHMLRALVEQQAHVFGAVDAMRRIQ